MCTRSRAHATNLVTIAIRVVGGSLNTKNTEKNAFYIHIHKVDKWAQMKSALCSKNNRLNLVEIVGYFLFWVGKKLLKLKTTQNEENQVDEMKKKISHLNTQKTQRIRCYLILKPIWKRSNVQCTWGARHEPHEQTEVKKREKNTHKQPKSNNTKSLNFKFVNKATNLNSQKIQTTRNTQWKMVWNSKHFLFDTIRDFFFRSLSHSPCSFFY